MGPEWKWSLKLNSTFYIGEPEKELPGSLLILGVIDRPQDYEFFQPSSLSALAGTSPPVASSATAHAQGAQTQEQASISKECQG